jgi:eukaryotic-like serine/threonine-protein kinase
VATALGRYELCGKLGEGGVATVYLGRVRGPHGYARTVAIKMLKPEHARSPEFLNMFIDEANLVSKLAHPNIVQLYELAEHEGQLFIAMEMLFGQSLADVWVECQRRHGRLRGDMVAWIGARVAEGLHHAHELCDATGKSQNLVHRDVNPSNIFITYDGHVKLIDFGLVKAVNRASMTEIGVVKGKLAYLSPEQAAGKPIDRRSDIFSLGTTLWELSSDQRLFRRETDPDTVRAVRDAQIPDPTVAIFDYPSLLWLVLRRALAADPDERYPTALELARDLDGVARAQGSIIQSATLAELMGELFGKERAREMVWLRAASADAALVAPSLPPTPGEDLLTLKPERPSAAGGGRGRRNRSPYLIPTVVEPSLPLAYAPPIPARTFKLTLGGAAAVLALLVVIVMTVVVLR